MTSHYYKIKYRLIKFDYFPSQAIISQLQKRLDTFSGLSEVETYIFFLYFWKKNSEIDPYIQQIKCSYYDSKVSFFYISWR